MATLKGPSTATKKLIALLLFSRLTGAKAGNIPTQQEGSWSFVVLLPCLVTIIGLQQVLVGKTYAKACVSKVVKTAQSNRALAMFVSTMCLWVICLEKPESQKNWYLPDCIVVLICAWEGLKTFVTADYPVFGPLPEGTIQPRVIPNTESISTQTEDREDPPEASYEASSTAVQTEHHFDDLLQTCTNQARIIRRSERAVTKYEHDLQTICNRRPTAHAVENIYLCPHGKVWHVSERCARDRTEAEDRARTAVANP